MRLPFATLEVFEAIARNGSLRAAAQSLGLRPSTVSHQLKNLEDQLGVALFARTTRSLALTEAGQLLHRGCGPALEQLEAAIEAARDAGRSRRGSLRVTMPGFAYDMFVADKLQSFRQAYPDIELEISIDEAFVDLFESRFHAGIRLGDRLDPDMVAVRIGPPLGLAVLASRAYLSRHGEPSSPQQLPAHECIRYRFASGEFAPWEFVGAEGAYAVKVSGNLIVDTLPALYSAVAAGLGLGYAFADYRPGGPAAASEIVPLLQEFTAPIVGTYLYYPREYKSRQPLRLFIEHLK